MRPFCEQPNRKSVFHTLWCHVRWYRCDVRWYRCDVTVLQGAGLNHLYMLWTHSSDVTWLRYTTNKSTSLKCSGSNVLKKVSLHARKSNFSIFPKIIPVVRKTVSLDPENQISIQVSQWDSHLIPSFWAMLNCRAAYLNHVTTQGLGHRIYRCVNTAPNNITWRHNYVTTSVVYDS